MGARQRAPAVVTGGFSRGCVAWSPTAVSEPPTAKVGPGGGVAVPKGPELVLLGPVWVSEIAIDVEGGASGSRRLGHGQCGRRDGHPQG